MKNIKLVITSVLNYLSLVQTNSLHLKRSRIRQTYQIDHHGNFSIFRETVSNVSLKGKLTVLVVGFRLKLIGSNPALHWLFQRICILTTPFWSGFAGFHIKLWMVDKETKNYLGIYEWSGQDKAQSYVDLLVNILKPLSTSNSVWYKIYPNQRLNLYLNKTHILNSKDFKITPNNVAVI